MSDEKHMGHWIIPGDWVIREAPDPACDDEYEFIRNPTGYALSDRAVFVKDVTKSHITVFDPVAGKTSILQLSAFPGNWKRATKNQVDATWERAGEARKDDMRVIEMEKGHFKYREKK